MAGRKAHCGGVLHEVFDTDRRWVLDEKSEDSASARERTNAGRGLGVDTHMHELRHSSLWAENAKGTVFSVDKISRGLNDSTKRCT
jgi:hypothetical protein